MLSEKHELPQSLDLLKRFLKGESLAALMASTGLSRRGIKSELCRTEERVATLLGMPNTIFCTLHDVKKLRQSSYLAAIEQLDDDQICGTSLKINYLGNDQFEQLVALTMQHSRHPERDAALAHVFFEIGLRFPEIAGLRVDDYLNNDGTVRVKSEIRQAIAANHKSRPVRWEKREVVLAVDAYLAARIVQKQSVLADPSHFRGLDPASNLFLNARSLPFESATVVKREKTIKSFESLYAVFTRMFDRIGVRRGTTSLGRATIAKNMDDQGYRRSAIATTLGCTPDSVAQLLRPMRKKNSAPEKTVST